MSTKQGNSATMTLPKPKNGVAHTVSSKDIPSSGSCQERCKPTVCRCCGKKGLLPILDLGMMPLTAAFVPANKINDPEPRFPLEVAFCSDCTLVQITET